MPIIMTDKKMQLHKIRVRSVIVTDIPGGPLKRFTAKDLLSGVGSGGATAEEARAGIMKYYEIYPDKLPATGVLVAG